MEEERGYILWRIVKSSQLLFRTHDSTWAIVIGLILRRRRTIPFTLVKHSTLQTRQQNGVGRGKLPKVVHQGRSIVRRARLRNLHGGTSGQGGTIA